MSRPGYEPSDLPPRGIALTVGGLLLALLLSIGLIVLMLLWFADGRPPAPLPDETPPRPRLESAPQPGRLRLEAAASRHINSYGWSDRARGLAHVPIERGMAIVAARGWGEDAPAPPPDEVAREHAEEAR